MTAYASNELISSSEFAKKFGTYLSQVQTHAVEKIAILKNNNIEAVLIAKDEYEMMQEAYQVQEHAKMYGSPKFKENQKIFQETYADIVSGKEKLTAYSEGMDELDAMIDEIEHAHSKK